MEVNKNDTTAFMPSGDQKPGFPGYYTLIPLVLLTLIGSILAAVIYVKKKSRLEELRHRLIPLYSYDPAEEQEEWGDAGREDEDAELTEPLCKSSQLTFTPDNRK
ncbi:uncharacterized protein C3orf18 homolog [Oryzias latipes]|uniref:uncharacterized protein C3orf18 homolog n=1 Tax=Oryzias latipes TaxID=8090 RepID=UPI0005CC5B61|nr:uncharacterized protein C3orf18 homolog [Oryzias latipes]XP_011474270.1 uncharacterized protein C3orf18 homolog [Oryzias latipes]